MVPGSVKAAFRVSGLLFLGKNTRERIGQARIDMEKEWFEIWFNSPYYHILYRDRDQAEARQFIDRLLELLRPAPQAEVLDLACGKGRYSRYLAQQGLHVTGLDLASESIRYARQFENERLSFFQHDMRRPFRINYFDYIFNFFTSFGYFETEKEHLRAMQTISSGLKPGGLFLLDFFNTDSVLANLVPYELKRVDHFEFHIRRSFDPAGYILKRIELEARGKALAFTERVRAFRLADFEELFRQSGLRLVQHFGNYQLAPFDLDQSNRLIVLARKI